MTFSALSYAWTGLDVKLYNNKNEDYPFAGDIHVLSRKKVIRPKKKVFLFPGIGRGEKFFVTYPPEYVDAYENIYIFCFKKHTQTKNFSLANLFIRMYVFFLQTIFALKDRALWLFVGTKYPGEEEAEAMGTDEQPLSDKPPLIRYEETYSTWQ